MEAQDQVGKIGRTIQCVFILRTTPAMVLIGGITDAKKTDVKHNKYPGDHPYIYYNILKKELTGSASE